MIFTNKHSNNLWVIFVLLVLVIQTGCISTTKLGLGGSVVTGSAGDTTEITKAKTDSKLNAASTSQGEAQELTKCIKPIATVALLEDEAARQRYSYVLTQNNLPPSPLPLIRLMFQQSNCFQIVDRNRGLSAITQEQKLAEQGLLRQDSNMAKGQLVAADYTIVPNIVFSEDDAGGGIGAAGALLPGIAGVLGGLKVSKKEAQVVLFLTDNRSGVQVAASEGSAKVSDVGFGGLGLTRMLGAAGGAWSNTNQGKVLAAAFLDATAKMINIIRSI